MFVHSFFPFILGVSLLPETTSMKHQLTVICSFLCLLSASAQEPTRWHGPSANGIYPETGLLREWPPDGPEMLWYTEGLGEGYSSPVTANGRIYISGMTGDTGFISVLTEDGKVINRFAYGEEFHVSRPGARSTPTVVGDRIYMLSGLGNFCCLDCSHGRIQWTRDLFDDFGGRNLRWGITESVVVDGDLVFCTPGGPDHNVVALDRQSGALVWTCTGEGSLSAYCTPLLVEFPTGKLLFTLTSSHILAIRALDGKLLWSHPYHNSRNIHPNTPIYHDGGLYCCSGYGHGGAMLELDSEGRLVRQKWFDPGLDSKIGGAVLVDGYIYGSGDKNRSWKALDWETGEKQFDSTKIGNGAVIAADGLLICYSQRGELALVPADPTAFRVTGMKRITLGTGEHWAHPVVDKGRILLRHGTVLMAFKIK
jgi:outer membrane protein assembly factor BamB